MGVAIPMSLKSSVVRKREAKGVVFFGILKRSIKLFLLGFFWNTIGTSFLLSKVLLFFLELFLEGWINLEKLRVPGVLQRFSITYFVVATTGLVFMPASEDKKEVFTYLLF